MAAFSQIASFRSSPHLRVFSDTAMCSGSPRLKMTNARGRPILLATEEGSVWSGRCESWVCRECLEGGLEKGSAHTPLRRIEVVMLLFTFK